MCDEVDGGLTESETLGTVTFTTADQSASVDGVFSRSYVDDWGLQEASERLKADSVRLWRRLTWLVVSSTIRQQLRAYIGAEDFVRLRANDLFDRILRELTDECANDAIESRSTEDLSAEMANLGLPTAFGSGGEQRRRKPNGRLPPKRRRPRVAKDDHSDVPAEDSFEGYWAACGGHLCTRAWLHKYGAHMQASAREQLADQLRLFDEAALLDCHRAAADDDDATDESVDVPDDTCWDDLWQQHCNNVWSRTAEQYPTVVRTTIPEEEVFETVADDVANDNLDEEAVSPMDSFLSPLDQVAAVEEWGVERGRSRNSSDDECEASDPIVVDDETATVDAADQRQGASRRLKRLKRRARSFGFAFAAEGFERFDDMAPFDDARGRLRAPNADDAYVVQFRKRPALSQPDGSTTTAADDADLLNFDFGFDAARDAHLIARDLKLPSADKELRKYWWQRFRLFSKLNDGVLMDRESWYSVTPERVAAHTADRLRRCHVVVDAFCGVGGNTIQLARRCRRVIAVDRDPVKLRCALQNALVYGVRERVDFVCADFLHVAPRLRADAVFLSPPWGGPQYLSAAIFDIDRGMQPCGFDIYRAARLISPNVALYLPRNSNVDQLLSLAGVGGKVEVEQNLLNNKVKSITAYFGNLVNELPTAE